jgi:hypothetical protein
VRRRGAPDGHHRVADELLDGAAVAGYHLGGELEVARQRLPDVFGVAFLGEGGESDEVGEEDRYEAALGHDLTTVRVGPGLGARLAGEDAATAGERGVAHSPQNLADGGSAVPQLRSRWPASMRIRCRTSARLVLRAAGRADQAAKRSQRSPAARGYTSRRPNADAGLGCFHRRAVQPTTDGVLALIRPEPRRSRRGIPSK